MFHKSFSKKDLIEILEILNIEIEDVKDYDKKQLVCHFQKYLDENAKGLFLPNILFIDTVDQLKTYLCCINQSKINTAQTRQLIMNKAKIKDKFFPVISEKCRAKMEEKKKIRQAQIGTAKVTHGHFVISFD